MLQVVTGIMEPSGCLTEICHRKVNGGSGVMKSKPEACAAAAYGRPYLMRCASSEVYKFTDIPTSPIVSKT